MNLILKRKVNMRYWLIYLFLFLLTNRVFPATFPEAFIDSTTQIPKDVSRLLPKAEAYAIKLDSNYSGFTPVAYQRINQLGGLSGQFCLIVFKSINLTVSEYKRKPCFSYVILDEKGTVITDGGGSKRVFLINVTTHMLCELAINQQSNRAEDNRVGDWVTITKVNLDNNGGQPYIPPEKYYLLNYGGRSDWRDDGETPVEWYSIIYLADFKKTGSLQILIHRYDFGKRSSSGKVFSEEWLFYKLNPTSQVYELSSLSASDLNTFKERAVTDPSVIGCEQYPSEDIDLRAYNIVSPHLSPYD